MEKELRKIMILESRVGKDLRIKLTQESLDFLYWLRSQIDSLDELEIYEMDETEFDYVEDVE